MPFPKAPKALVIAAGACLLLVLAALLLGGLTFRTLELKRGLFKESAAEGLHVCKLKGEEARWLQRGFSPHVHLQGASLQMIDTADELQASTEPAFRMKKMMLYVNEPLWTRIPETGPGVALKIKSTGPAIKVGSIAGALFLLLGMYALLNGFAGEPAAKTPASSTRRMHALDSLRGIAAAIVAMGHAVGYLLPEHWHALLQMSPITIYMNTNLMVFVFWVLSGLVLAIPLLASASYRRIAVAAGKRYFRLAPLVLGTTLLSFLAYHLGGYQVIQTLGDRLGNGAVNIALSDRHPPGLLGAVREGLYLNFTFNGPLWTVQLEMVGSMVLFGVVACTLPLRHRRLLWVALLGVFSFVTQQVYLGCFMSGLLLADLWLTHRNDFIMGRVPTFCLLAVAIGLGSMNPGWLNRWMREVPPHLNELNNLLVASLLVMLAVFSPLCVRLLSARWLVWLGERSFAVYVLHAITFHLVGYHVTYWALLMNLPPLPSGILGLLAYVLVTLWLADWVTKRVDLPSTLMAGKVGNWLAGTPPEEAEMKAAPKATPRAEALPEEVPAPVS